MPLALVVCALQVFAKKPGALLRASPPVLNGEVSVDSLFGKDLLRGSLADRVVMSVRGASKTLKMPHSTATADGVETCGLHSSMSG